MKFTHFEVVDHIRTSNVSHLNTDQSRTSEMPIRNNTRYDKCYKLTYVVIYILKYILFKSKKIIFLYINNLIENNLVFSIILNNHF